MVAEEKFLWEAFRNFWRRDGLSPSLGFLARPCGHGLGVPSVWISGSLFSFCFILWVLSSGFIFFGLVFPFWRIYWIDLTMMSWYRSTWFQCVQAIWSSFLFLSFLDQSGAFHLLSQGSSLARFYLSLYSLSGWHILDCSIVIILVFR